MDADASMTARFGRSVLALTLLAAALGCQPEDPAPSHPGVSVAMRYPVLLIGQASLDVRDSEQALTSIPGASSLNLNERKIVDSEGRLFRVVRAQPVAGQRSILWDMGTGERRFYVEVAEARRPGWADIQALVIAEVRTPTSPWHGDPRAVARVHSSSTPAELIEASRESWSWAR